VELSSFLLTLFAVDAMQVIVDGGVCVCICIIMDAPKGAILIGSKLIKGTKSFGR
jgi:hypothetical protein